jgi:hypothetical protein
VLRLLSRVQALRAVAAVATAALVVTAGAAVAGQTAATPTITQGIAVLPTIDDAGTATTFPLHWAAPTAGAKALIVVFHGHTHNGDQWQDELNTMAARNNAVAVAPRTSEIDGPNGKGVFDTVDEEARDAASAIAWSRRVHGNLPTYLLCVSMGCTGLAYFISMVARGKSTSADARWMRANRPRPIAGIVVSEGLSNLSETWAEAGAADKTSQAEIEYETRTATGSATPPQNSDAYRTRSLAMLSPTGFREFGAKTAAVVHDVDDGLVPFNQAIESRAALRAGGIPTHGYTIVGNQPGCNTENETTFTSYVGSYVETYTGRTEVKDNLDPTLCMSGHAGETHPETTVMRVTFDVLHRMLTAGVGSGESTIQPTVR